MVFLSIQNHRRPGGCRMKNEWGLRKFARYSVFEPESFEQSKKAEKA